MTPVATKTRRLRNPCFQINGAAGQGYLEVQLVYEGVQIALAVIDALGNMTQGPWGYDDAQLAAPPSVGNMITRCRMSGSPGMATIGHCVLVKN